MILKIMVVYNHLVECFVRTFRKGSLCVSPVSNLLNLARWSPWKMYLRPTYSGRKVVGSWTKSLTSRGSPLLDSRSSLGVWG